MKYNYYETMKSDIRDWITMNGIIDYANEEEMTKDQLVDYLSDELWDKDEITGNGYHWYDSEDKCAEYVSHNMDLLYDAVNEYGLNTESSNILKYWEQRELARYFDCTIRCYILYGCIQDVVNEFKNDLEQEEE